MSEIATVILQFFGLIGIGFGAIGSAIGAEGKVLV